MKKIFFLLLLSAVALAESRYVNETLGFSFVPPKVDFAGAAGNFMGAQAGMPPVDGFSANVNVLLQNYGQSLQDYVNLSKGQFVDMGWKATRAEVVGGAAFFEYTGNYQGTELHWYSRAFKKGDWIYLVTGTVLASRWDLDKGPIKASVDSFKLSN